MNKQGLILVKNVSHNERGLIMFHEKLRQMRKRSNLTQQDLADALGIDRTTITKYESGVSTPPADAIKKMCTVLKVSMDFMMDTDLENQHPDLDKHVLLLQRAADENHLNETELQDIIEYAKYRYPSRFKGLTDGHKRS